MSSLSQTTISPGLLQITLNRPEAFNALSESLLSELQEFLNAVSQSKETRVVILAASGKAFCAGHDLKEMMQAPSESYYQSLFQKCSELMLTIQRMPQPVIAQVQGIATAAGCQLVANVRSRCCKRRCKICCVGNKPWAILLNTWCCTFEKFATKAGA